MRLVLVPLMFFAILSCSPENNEVQDEQVDTGSETEAVDSIANTAPDGVETEGGVDSPGFPLPQPVLQLLAQKYPGYREPSLAETAREKGEQSNQGPTVVRGNFTDDAQQDYALQLQHGKDLLIVAVTDTGNGAWSAHELKRDILFNDRGTLKSLYYLHLATPGQALYDEAAGKEFKLQREAIQVGLDGNITTYVYSRKGFKGYNTTR